MGYMDAFNKQGIRLSVRHNDIVWFDPMELVPDELLSFAMEHREELVAEIRVSTENPDSSTQEIISSYRFLWVATDLTSFEEYDPRFGYEVGRNPVYRMLDAQYYAWLRHRMENVSKAHGNGMISDDEYTVLRDRFNVINNWAIAHIGKDVLRRAMRTTNIARYVPPSDDTLNAYYQTWRKTRNANKDRVARLLDSVSDPNVAKLRDQLSTRGYALIKSPIVDDTVLFVWDDGVIIPSELSDKTKFTMDELILMIGLTPDAVKQIIDVKQIFGGKVVPGDYEGSTCEVINSKAKQISKQLKLATQGSMF
ncbi:MAG: hypothetical protein ACYC27_19610 [Armatimonadota bacterium]